MPAQTSRQILQIVSTTYRKLFAGAAGVVQGPAKIATRQTLGANKRPAFHSFNALP